MDARIFGILQRVQAEPDEAKRDELKELSKHELAAHFRLASNHADLQELAFDLFNIAFRDVQAGDLVSTLIEVKRVGLNDTDFIEEDLRGMRAYFQGKGGQIRSDILRAERQQMPREELVTAIDMHLDDWNSDFWGSVSRLQAQCQEKVRSAPAEKLVELIVAAVTPGGTFAKSTLSSAQVDPILDAVSIASKGMRPVIFGTNIAIRGLANVGLDYGPTIQGEIFQSGVVARYKGSGVVELAQFEDFNGQQVIPNDELFIIGWNAGRMTFFGDTPKTQVLQEESFMRRWEAARDVGMALYGAPKGRVSRIVLT